MNNNLVNEITASQLRHDLPDFSSGDEIKVSVRIVEGAKTRKNGCIRHINAKCEIDKVKLFKLPAITKDNICKYNLFGFVESNSDVNYYDDLYDKSMLFSDVDDGYTFTFAQLELIKHFTPEQKLKLAQLINNHFINKNEKSDLWITNLTLVDANNNSMKTQQKEYSSYYQIMMEPKAVLLDSIKDLLKKEATVAFTEATPIPLPAQSTASHQQDKGAAISTVAPSSVTGLVVSLSH